MRFGNYLSEINSHEENSSGMAEEFASLAEDIKKASPDERGKKVELYLEAILKHTLKLPPSERIDPDQNFAEMGIDSLMAMEMRNRLQGALGDKILSVSALQESRTLRSLAAHMAKLVNSEVSPSETPINDLVLQDCQLPAELELNLVRPVRPSEVGKICLTGAFGTLSVVGFYSSRFGRHMSLAW